MTEQEQVMQEGITMLKLCASRIRRDNKAQDSALLREVDCFIESHCMYSKHKKLRNPQSL